MLPAAHNADTFKVEEAHVVRSMKWTSLTTNNASNYAYDKYKLHLYHSQVNTHTKFKDNGSTAYNVQHTHLQTI